tara:strand:+ start:95 stop:649 length:555 start_codon:yes stop_codon:yes gene_type:complete
MSKEIDPIVLEVLKKLQFKPKDCLWLHPQSQKYLMLHKYVEIAAAKTNITYELHEVEFNTLEKIAVVKCVANHSEKIVTTYGEASPGNCKNNYPVAMAEKRAIDRAVLKLLGIHGFVYSDSEMDVVEKQEKKQENKPSTEKELDDAKQTLKEAHDNGELKQAYHELPSTLKTQLRDFANALRAS